MKLGFFSLLFLLFLGLKLGGVIAWSWWWVTAPLWGGFALVAVFLLVAFIGCLFISALSSARKSNGWR